MLRKLNKALHAGFGSCNDRFGTVHVHRERCNSQRKSRRSRRGNPIHASREDSANLLLWQQRRQLESLLRLSNKAAGEGESDSPSTSSPGAGQTLRDVPLWRIQTAVLPGSQEILHVHVPHYTHMFEQLMAGPRPWHFGHIYLPKGSRNLGNPEYDLAPGSKAPLAGTLMEVLSSLWLKDGRLLLLAVGVSRIRVVNATQVVPYSRADVEIWPDEEEVAAQMDTALEAVDRAHGGTESDTAAVMRMTGSAATAAAVASSQAWLDYELAPLRALVKEEEMSNLSPGEGPRGRTGMFAPPKLLWRGIMASLQGLRPPAQRGPPVGQDEFVQPPHLLSDLPVQTTKIASALAEASERAAERAFRAAQATAAEALSQAGGPHEDTADLSWQGRGRLNTTVDRGIPSQGVSETTAKELENAGRGGSAGSSGRCSEVETELLVLERLIWQTLDSIAVLAARAKKVVKEVLLPPGILQLRPLGTEAAAAAAADDLPGSRDLDTERRYPALRRAQRLGFYLAAFLQDGFDVAEGRQAVLEASSTAARLQLVLDVLIAQRKRLQALAAIRAAQEES